MTAPGPYISAADAKVARARLTKYTTEQIDAKVAEFESIIERARGCAYVVRTRTVELQASRRGTVFLIDPFIGSITSCTVNDVAVDADVLAALVPRADGSVTGWTFPAEAWVGMTYTYGTDPTPDIVLEATLEFVERALGTEVSGMTRDTRWTSPDGAESFILPNWDKEIFTGWTEVDRRIRSLTDYRGIFG